MHHHGVRLGILNVRSRERHRSVQTVGLRGAAVLVREQRRGDADVVAERSEGLLGERRLVRLPAEASERGGLLGDVPHVVRVAAVRRGKALDRRLVDGLQQAEPDHLRSEPRRDQDAVRERTELRIDDRVRRRAQPIRLAVRVRARLLGVGHARRRLGRHAQDRVGLQLIAVDRIRLRPAVLVRAAHAEPQQEPQERLVTLRGCAATVVVVTAGARRCVVGGAEPVAPHRCRRCGHPVPVEDTITDLERPAVVRAQVAEGMHERLVAVIEHGGVTAQQGGLRDLRRAGPGARTIAPARRDGAQQRRPRGQPGQRTSHGARGHRLITMPSALAICR